MFFMILDFKGFLLKIHISECNYPGLNLICVYGKKVNKTREVVTHRILLFLEPKTF